MQVASRDYVNDSNRNNTGIRRVEAEDPRLRSLDHYTDASERQNNYQSRSAQNMQDSTYATQEQEQDLARKRSIPRKEVGTGAVGQSVNPTTPSATSSTHRRQTSSQKPLPTAPHEQQARRSNDTRAPDVQSQIRDGAYVHDGPLSAEEVISRAKGNTYDTEVIEAIAPGKCISYIKYSLHNEFLQL